MKNQKIDKKWVSICIDTASVCFFNYPLNAYLYEGIENAHSFYRSQSQSTLKKASRRKELYILDNNPRALMFVRYGSINTIVASMDMIPIFLSAFFRLKAKDVRTLINRYKRIKLIYRPHWQETFVGKDYYHLVMIAVHPDLKGTGAFRKLIEPLLNQADTEKKPVILETHNPKLIDLYTHFGFELVQTLSNKNIDLKQYCMIRYPK